MTDISIIVDYELFVTIAICIAGLKAVMNIILGLARQEKPVETNYGYGYAVNGFLTLLIIYFCVSIGW